MSHGAVTGPAEAAPTDVKALSRVLLDRMRGLEEGTYAHQYARNTLVELNLTLVRFAARRFRRRHEGMEDIVQVGTIGLIKAIDRFDLSREVEFATFAVPYITGEIKRHFRDNGWAVHVPRALQERAVALTAATTELSQRLDHEPTHAELAEHLGLSGEQVGEAIKAGNGHTAGSLDLPGRPGDSEGSAYADRFGEEDPAIEAVENLHVLKPLLAQLGDRDRRILAMRFGAEMTQAEIGAALGISQMHASRLLTRILTRLRAGMLPQARA
ncbi:SigB/SigF/SigG family RNA polymerase sigma factor [Streptomyces sp. NPDC058405]|uniref:SigB/SigF/SigG family RNA polymerase sigma factor n=1 Tax=unclassified Streptomyces TaxID=2593676 RepID=UPI00365904C2